jgi:hypothetical protein
MPHRSTLSRCLLLAVALAAGPAMAATDAPTLLFHVDAGKGLEAVVAQGEAVPNFRDKVDIVDDGARGKAIQWQDDGLLAWDAPGNILAQPSTGARATQWVKHRS